MPPPMEQQATGQSSRPRRGGWLVGAGKIISDPRGGSGTSYARSYHTRSLRTDSGAAYRMLMVVTNKLGGLLRTARLGWGWDQAQFARQLGVVGQQTVSRWERGTSRPRRAMVPRIAQALGMEAQILFDAMADERPAPAREPSLPVRPL